MGLSLTLIPERFPNQTPSNFVRLPLTREDHDMYDELRENAVPLGCAMTSYDDEGLVETEVDGADGDPLVFLNAGRLANLMDKHFNGKACAWDLAVFAFINALPKQNRVILYWD
jgi:hypothetical protein